MQWTNNLDHDDYFLYTPISLCSCDLCAAPPFPFPPEVEYVQVEQELAARGRIVPCSGGRQLRRHDGQHPGREGTFLGEPNDAFDMSKGWDGTSV
jgi:hypothetical protein